MTNWLGGNRLRDVVFAMLFITAGLASAEPVPDLYAISVPVAEQSPNELRRAAAAGMRELAVRISGRSSAASEPALAAAFGNAMHFLEQYRYERNGGGDTPWLAQLRFAASPVDAELRKAGLPVWGGNRPAVLTVLVVDDKGVRAVIDDSSAYANVLREQWRRRGLVLHLPRNASGLNVDDVVRLDGAKVRAAIQERSDGLMLAFITLTAGGNCDSRWSLNLGAQVFEAEAAGSALSICAANAIDRIVDNFSAQYAIAANSSNEGLVMRVTGVVSFGDYMSLLSYLRRLEVIRNVQPVLISGDEIFLQLKTAGDADQVTRQLALESRLAPLEGVVNVRLPSALNYRWAASH